MKRFFVKIKDFFRYDIPYGFENLFLWFSIIWKDRNWDYYYIYIILRHKLHLTEKHIREYNNHVKAEKDADNIKKCVLILDRLIKDNYSPVEKHMEKWGDPEFKFIDIEDKPGFSSLDIIHPNVKTKEDEIQERKDFRFAINREELLKKQDLDMLFHLMRKHIQTWWD